MSDAAKTTFDVLATTQTRVNVPDFVGNGKALVDLVFGAAMKLMDVAYGGQHDILVIAHPKGGDCIEYEFILVRNGEVGE